MTHNPEAEPAITLYGLQTCSHCKDAKKYLQEQGKPFKTVYVDMLVGDERNNTMRHIKRINPAITFPTLQVGEKNHCRIQKNGDPDGFGCAWELTGVEFGFVTAYNGWDTKRIRRYSSDTDCSGEMWFCFAMPDAYGVRPHRAMQFNGGYLVLPPGDLTSQYFFLDLFLKTAQDRRAFYVPSFSNDFEAIGPWTVHQGGLEVDLYSLFNNFAYMGLYTAQGLPKAVSQRPGWKHCSSKYGRGYRTKHVGIQNRCCRRTALQFCGIGWL